MSAFDLISDLHKDARGFRPGADFMADFNAQTDAKKQETWDYLCEQLERRELEESMQELDAQRRFESRIQGMMTDHGIDRATAIRWEIDANDLVELMAEAIELFGTAEQEVDHFLWDQGLAFQIMPMYRTEIEAAVQ